MNNPYDQKYHDYSKAVLSGDIVACEAIKLACRRYESFFDRDDIEFRPDACDKVVNFIHKIKHFAGKSAHKPFILEPWQRWCIYNIFGFFWKGTNERVTKKVLMTIARKNGKSAFAAAIGLYLLVADGVPGTQVLNVANNTTQAHLLFDMESNFLHSLDPKHKYFRFLRDSIRFERMKSYAKVLSSDAQGHDGFGGHFICDETHEYKDSKLWDVLIGGQGYMESPLAINISTYGYNVNGYLYNHIQTCKAILKGEKEDDAQFSAMYELDEQDDWHDENVWIKANPNMDVTVSKTFIRDQVLTATNNSTYEFSVRTKNLNQWVQSKDIWIPETYISANMIQVDWEDVKGETCYGGADFSAVSDLTSWTLMFPPNEDRSFYPDRFIFKTVLYVPESTYEESPNAQEYMQWARTGDIVPISGNTVDYDYILDDQINTLKENELNLVKLAYDEWNARQWAIDATNEGIPIEPFSQTLGNFNIPTKAFEMLLKQGKVVMDLNSCVKFCFSNSELKFDHNDNCKPVKAHNNKNNKIDAVISMLESFGIYLLDPNVANDVIFLSNV